MRSRRASRPANSLKDFALFDFISHQLFEITLPADLCQKSLRLLNIRDPEISRAKEDDLRHKVDVSRQNKNLWHSNLKKIYNSLFKIYLHY